MVGRTLEWLVDLVRLLAAWLLVSACHELGHAISAAVVWRRAPLSLSFGPLEGGVALVTPPTSTVASRAVVAAGGPALPIVAGCALAIAFRRRESNTITTWSRLIAALGLARVGLAIIATAKGLAGSSDVAVLVDSLPEGLRGALGDSTLEAIGIVVTMVSMIALLVSLRWREDDESDSSRWRMMLRSAGPSAVPVAGMLLLVGFTVRVEDWSVAEGFDVFRVHLGTAVFLVIAAVAASLVFVPIACGHAHRRWQPSVVCVGMASLCAWLSISPMSFRGSALDPGVEPRGDLSARDDNRQMIEDAISLSESGRHGESASVWQHLTVRLPRQATVWAYLGVELFRAGRLAESEAALQDALRRRSDPVILSVLPAIHHYLGRIRLGRGDTKDACAHFRSQLRLDPDGKALLVENPRPFVSRVPECLEDTVDSSSQTASPATSRK